MQLFVFNQLEQLIAVLKENVKDPIWLEKINAENTFDFSFPATDSQASFLTEGNLVSFKDADGNFQLFEIVKVNEIHNSDGLMKHCHCENAFYELNDDWIEDRRPTNATAEYALGQALLGTRWTVGTVNVSGVNSIIFYQQSVLKSIHEIVEKWGGEIRARVVLSGSSIVYRYLDFFQTRGNITGKRFEYKHDLKSIEREVDLSETKTALYGFGRGEETDTGGFGRRINFSSIVWTKPPNPANKPAGQKWVEDVDAKALWGRPLGGVARNRFGDFINEDETDPATLLQKTWAELQKRKNPRVSYALSVADLEKLSGHAHDAVRLGDTVIVVDREFVNPIEVTARVIEIQRHLTNPTQTEIILANFFPDAAEYFSRLKDLETSHSDWESLGRAALKTTWLDGIINVLNNQIQTSDGKVTITDAHGILIENAAQTKALRLLGGILALSNTKVSGEYQWRTFATGDGFVCDELLAGTITAQTIKLKTGATQAAIQSDNYVAGTTGWIIRSDGSVEFSSGVFRGTLSGASGTFAGDLTGEDIICHGTLFASSGISLSWGIEGSGSIVVTGGIEGDYLYGSSYISTPGYLNVSGRIWTGSYIYASSYLQAGTHIFSAGDGVYNSSGGAGRFKFSDSAYLLIDASTAAIYLGGVIRARFMSGSIYSTDGTAGRFHFNASNYFYAASGLCRVFVGGAVKVSWTSLPKVRLDPDGEGVVTERSFGVNNPGSFRPMLLDLVEVDGSSEVVLSERFKLVVDDYKVFVDKGIITKKTSNSFEVEGQGKISCLIVGIEKGKEDVWSYDMVESPLVEVEGIKKRLDGKEFGNAKGRGHKCIKKS